MPYAPEEGFSAWTFQLLSLSQREFRYRNCRLDQRNRRNIRLAICRWVSRRPIRRAATPVVAAASLPCFDAVARKLSTWGGWLADEKGRGPVWTDASGLTRPPGLAIAAG